MFFIVEVSDYEFSSWLKYIPYILMYCTVVLKIYRMPVHLHTQTKQRPGIDQYVNF